MYKYAFDLNIPIEAARTELNNLNDEWKTLSQQERQKTNAVIAKHNGIPINNGLLYFYPLDQFCSANNHAVKELVKTFNGAFLNKIRITNYQPGKECPFHIDNDSAGEGYWGDEIPAYMVAQCSIHILLSPPIGEVTTFAHDMNLKKQPSWNLDLPKTLSSTQNISQDLQTIDSMVLGDKAAIINTGAWHQASSHTENARTLASLSFWPTITFSDVVEYCKDHHLLAEAPNE